MLRIYDKLPKCQRDAKGRHNFEKVGVWKDEYILYQCSQCKQCVYEDIVAIQHKEVTKCQKY